MVALVKRRVYLYGHLAEQFGEHYDLAVKSPAEAIRLLEANFPRKFTGALRQGYYQVVIGPREGGLQIDEKMVPFNFPKGDFHIVPVPEGAGGSSSSKGIFMVILGVALIATAFMGAAFLAGGAIAGLSATAVAGVTWGQIGLIGLAVGLAGIAHLLTPAAKGSSGASTDSFFFNGATNSTAEGGCVPVVYGRVRAGTVVVSAGVSNERIDPTYAYKLGTDTTSINLDPYSLSDSGGAASVSGKKG